MVVGLILRVSTNVSSVLDTVSFDYQMFFNLLLPPIILSAGYELHQGNFFRHIGTILTFAFAGTFISATVLGIILYVWTWIALDGLKINFVEAMSVGATLSATDPITILAIFNTYKVEPKLYTIIFGESILNDAAKVQGWRRVAHHHKSLRSCGHFLCCLLWQLVHRSHGRHRSISHAKIYLCATIPQNRKLSHYPHCLRHVLSFQRYSHVW
jgi:hypothetical protein